MILISGLAYNLLIKYIMANDQNKKFLTGLPSWLFIGAVAVLFPVFALMTAESVNRLKKTTTRLLVEKGAALIRSFEAGTRTGMMHTGRGGGRFRLQHLLTETAKQPDIVHILVTDIKGRIVAHDEQNQIGKIYSDKLDLEKIFSLNIVQSRVLSKPGKQTIFEVFRKFSPPHGPPGGSHPMMLMTDPPPPDEPCEANSKDKNCKDQSRWIIFIGLDMSSVEEIQKEETRQIVIVGVILLIIGLAGVILLFIVQNHRLSEIRSLRKQVEKNQRLASIVMLAAGVAHEIRNPLSSIKGFATYFKERYRDVPEDQHIADIMIQETDRMNRVVSQLLEFARPLRIIKRTVCLNTLVKDSLKLIERQAHEKHIEIRTTLLPQSEQINLDPDKLNQLLLNLYLNAIEAMSDGGLLSVSVSKEKKGILIQVSDNGCGIRKEDLAHVFDPYFTTKSSGTGLGLAIVNNIVEAHEGKISIDSNAGKGTIVSIFLPILNRDSTD